MLYKRPSSEIGFRLFTRKKKRKEGKEEKKNIKKEREKQKQRVYRGIRDGENKNWKGDAVGGRHRLYRLEDREWAEYS